MVWLPVFVFLMCIQMLIHVVAYTQGFMDTIARWGYMDTVRESALKEDSGITALVPQFRTFLRLSMAILCAQ